MPQRRFFHATGCAIIAFCIATLLNGCTFPPTPARICHLPADIAFQQLPLVADGMIYFGGEFGTVSALNASDGKVIWRTTITQNYLKATPVLANGVLYFGVNNHAVALSASDGKVIWQTNDTQQSSYYGTPALNVQDGLLYFTDGNSVIALHSADGTPAWSTQVIPTMTTYDPLAVSIKDSPVVAGDTVYVGADGVYALDATSGKLRWHTATSVTGAPYAAPVIVGDTLYVSAIDNTESAPQSTPIGKSSYVDALRASDGQRLWHAIIAGWDATNVMIHGATAYLGVQSQTSDGHGFSTIVAIATATGAQQWSAQQAGMINYNSDFPPLVTDDAIYLGGHPLTALDATSHERRWSIGGSYRPATPAAVVAGVLYVGLGGAANFACGATHQQSIDGTVLALHTDNGQVIWKQTLPSIQTP